MSNVNNLLTWLVDLFDPYFLLKQILRIIGTWMKYIFAYIYISLRRNASCMHGIEKKPFLLPFFDKELHGMIIGRYLCCVNYSSCTPTIARLIRKKQSLWLLFVGSRDKKKCIKVYNYKITIIYLFESHQPLFQHWFSVASVKGLHCSCAYKTYI